MKKILLISTSMLLAISILFTSVSCSPVKESGKVTTEKTVVEVKELQSQNLLDGYQSSITDKGEVTKEFKDALNDFSFKLYKAVTEKNGKNVIVSPLSVYICLALIANGAEGETRSQMEEVLGMKVEEVNESLYNFVDSLSSSEKCKVSIANSVWLKDTNGNIKVNSEYLQEIADWYDSEIYKAPFDETTLKDINNWCSNKTDGLINKILDEINPQSVAYLINAVLFDAKWENAYKDQDIIENYDFTNYDKTKTKVTMLHSREGVYYTGKDFVGTQKRYAGGQYSLVVLLPNSDVDIYDFVNSLDRDKWAQVIMSHFARNSLVDVNLLMPEFESESEMPLNDVLQSMGMKDAFNSNADFTNMFNESKKGDFCISSIKQKAIIKVNKEGTKAAAVTIGEMTATAVEPPITTVNITLDRPFVYAIVDNFTFCPLFVGVNVNINN